MEERAITRSKASRVPAAVAALPRSYLALMGEFPLRPIRSNAAYDRAASIVHRLAMLDRLDAGEQEYLEVLEALVERYDRQAVGNYNYASPTQILKMLVEQAGMTVSELGRLLGSKGAASELLNGKRKEPSKAQIAKLCDRFKVDAALFLLPVVRPADAA